MDNDPHDGDQACEEGGARGTDEDESEQREQQARMDGVARVGMRTLSDERVARGGEGGTAAQGEERQNHHQGAGGKEKPGEEICRERCSKDARRSRMHGKAQMVVKAPRELQTKPSTSGIRNTRLLPEIREQMPDQRSKRITVRG